MIQIGQIKIQDTGYILPTNAGEQAVGANMANGGVAMILKTADFTPSLTRSVQSSPELSSNTPARINLGSLENMNFELRCTLKTNNTTDMSYIPELLKMVSTNGYKVMWYNYTPATILQEKNNGQLLFQIAKNSKFGRVFTAAEKTEFTISEAFYHLNVLFFDIQEVHTGTKDTIEYSLKGVVIKVEADTL